MRADPRGSRPQEEPTRWTTAPTSSSAGERCPFNAGLAQGNGRSELPKMQRAGWTDVSNVAVTVNELTPVSEPLYAVA